MQMQIIKYKIQVPLHSYEWHFLSSSFHQLTPELLRRRRTQGAQRSKISSDIGVVLVYISVLHVFRSFILRVVLLTRRTYLYVTRKRWIRRNARRSSLDGHVPNILRFQRFNSPRFYILRLAFITDYFSDSMQPGISFRLEIFTKNR